MKTEDLIGLLTEDTPAGSSLGRLARALTLAVAASALLLVATIGLRPDLLAAIGTARVLFKIGFTLLLAGCAAAILFRVGMPGLPLAARARMLAAPLGLLLGGIAAELFVLPRGAWEASLIGQNAAFCVFFIPVLALAPLTAGLWALRSGAPDNPGLAGGGGGLAAGGIAAALYAWHCPDDSLLFVATWYTIALTIVTLAGWAIGRRTLRW